MLTAGLGAFGSVTGVVDLLVYGQVLFLTGHAVYVPVGVGGFWSPRQRAPDRVATAGAMVPRQEPQWPLG